MKTFKKFFLSLTEDFSSAKMLAFDIGSKMVSRKLIVFVEQVGKINFPKYLSSFSVSRMRDFTDDIDTIRMNGLRFIITEHKQGFFVAIWVGNTLHDQIAKLFDHNKTDKPEIPQIPFQQRYNNAYSRTFDVKQPLFPGVLMDDGILTGIPLTNVLKMKSMLNALKIDETEIEQD